MIKLEFVGESPRLFPDYGEYEPGQVAKFTKSEAEVLLATGYFVEAKPAEKQKPPEGRGQNPGTPRKEDES